MNVAPTTSAAARLPIAMLGVPFDTVTTADTLRLIRLDGDEGRCSSARMGRSGDEREPRHGDGG